jgi:hypothetical protein
MTIKQLLDTIKDYKNRFGMKDTDTIKVACDEEWNTIYNDIEINQDDESKAWVIFGLSGSEDEDNF